MLIALRLSALCLSTLCLSTLGVGCTAKFSDLRPDEGSGDDASNGNGNGNGTGGDGGTDTAVGCGFGVSEEPSGGSIGISSDEGTVLRQTPPDGLQGRSGYEAMGQVSLVELTDGSLELRFGADFEVSNGPNLRVVLSSRENLRDGLSEDKGDLDLGAALVPDGASRPQGEQSFGVPSDIGPCSFVHVYCGPFEVSFGAASLVEP